MIHHNDDRKMHCSRQISMNKFKVKKRIDSALNNSIKDLSLEMRQGWCNVGWDDVKVGRE